MSERTATLCGVTTGDLATWVGSVGIVLTLAATTAQLGYEMRARRKERQRAQATAVSGWYTAEDVRAEKSLFTLSNRSDEPIYEVVAMLVYIQGAAPRTGEDWGRVEQGRFSYCSIYGALGPGLWTMTVDSPWGVMQGRPGCEMGFTDAGGRHWIRRANGRLDRIKTNAIDHYGLPRPIDYAAPVRYDQVEPLNES